MFYLDIFHQLKCLSTNIVPYNMSTSSSNSGVIKFTDNEF